MIKANHTFAGKSICNYIAEFELKKAFHSVNYKGDHSDTGLPILMIANHFSWWDGFIQYHLNNRLYKRKFHVMMLEEQLSRHKILNGAGAYSIRKNSRDLLESLHYTAQLLEIPTNLVLIFPQGKIQSQHLSFLPFEKGLGYLLSHCKNNIQLIFNINLVDYLSDRQPHLFVYYKRYDITGQTTLKEVENAFNAFFTDCKFKQIERNG